MGKLTSTEGRDAKARSVAFKGYKDGSVEFFGDQIEVLTGYSRQGFNSKATKWTDIVLDEDRQDMKIAFVKALKGDKTYNREYRIRAKDDRKVWVQEWGQIVCDAAGEIESVTGIIVDITEQKRSDMDRQKSEERTGKYLTFSLAGQEYGISILRVREIIEMMPITPVPQAPHFIKGVINLRGKVIPVVDLRGKFGMESVEHTGRTCIIVVEIEGRSARLLTGIIVDSVSDVLQIKGEDIEDAPSFIAQLDADYIMGMAKIEKSVKVLLDIDCVLSDMESVGA